MWGGSVELCGGLCRAVWWGLWSCVVGSVELCGGGGGVVKEFLRFVEKALCGILCS